MVRGNALLVLDLGLDVVYPYCQPKSSFFGVAMQAPSDAVRCVALPSCGAGICVPMVSLLSTANKLVHALIHSVRMRYTFERDGLARQGLHEDLHLWRCCECAVRLGWSALAWSRCPSRVTPSPTELTLITATNICNFLRNIDFHHVLHSYLEFCRSKN